jgi:fatty-acyl-CoA synthase
MQAPFSRTFIDLLCEQAERYPDQLAVIDEFASYSYPQLRARSFALAAALQASGVGAGDRVAVLLNNRSEWIEICAAASALGAIATPFSTWSTGRELDFLLRDSGACILFMLDHLGERSVTTELAPLFNDPEQRPPALRDIVVLGEDPATGPITQASSYASFLTRASQFDLPPPGERARSHEVAFILYTSGSTAHPKAVPNIHGAVIENGFHIGERQGLTPLDRVLLPAPLFWSYGAANAMMATFTHGATLVLQGRFEPEPALTLIEQHGCTSIYTLPAITHALITHHSFSADRTRSLRTAMTIGTPQDIATVAQVLGAPEVCNVYGQTESYGNCCVTWHHWPLERRMVVQGPPLPGVTLRIVNPDTGASLPAGEIGAIEVKGYLTPGYLGESEAQNAEAFTADGFFRTGDLGSLTPEGDLVFKARTSEMIKRAGINIAPADIEDVLRQHPAVAAAGVTSAPDALKGEIIVAYIVLAGGATADRELLRSHCRALAAAYKTPDRFEFIDALPVTNTGKLLRRELKNMAGQLVTSVA